jgi:hypothetical protein
MKKAIVLCGIMLGIISATSAQEILLPLSNNPSLQAQHETWTPTLKAGTALALPFLDDFSYTGYYPVASKWLDNFAFVNRTFGPLPTTLGMVTLDALDDTGAVYTWATPTPFQADYLTSQPLRLDSIFVGSPDIMQVSDSLYFSFYYQPQGYGNPPDEEDSLILEFYDPTSDDWYKVWGSGGISYASFFAQYHRTFRQVMIPIIDTMYLKNGFQFRFRNYASIANSNLPSWQSNMDQWNLDYVYLDFNRYKYDTAYADVAFVNAAPSLLKSYMQMPSRQYVPSELKDTLKNVITNLNSTINNISYRYTVKEVNGAFTYTHLGGDYDINPFNTNGYHAWSFHTAPAVDFALPALIGDSVAFEVTHALGINGWADDLPTNDTMRFVQKFYNYYAYDDGSAEAGYGLAGTGSRLAYRFTLNQPDTLGAVNMFFNQTYTPPTSRYFYLMVWESLSPEKVLYKSKRLRPYVGDSLNAFHTYFIADSIVKLSGTFYVGWQQITDEVLNIGYDINTDASTHVFYNTEGSWQPTVYDGSPMIRPVMGTGGQSKKHDDIYYSDALILKIFPNPTGLGYLNLSLPGKYMNMDPENTMTVEIFNYFGQKLKEVPYSSQIDINDLDQGFYLLRLNSYSSSESVTKSFIISR